MRKKILLTTINAKWIHPSLALRLLKANLGEYEDDAEILEFALRQPLAEKTAPILAAHPQILGLSVAIWNHRASIELLEALFREWEKDGEARPVIVMGGPETSSLPKDAELFKYADFVVRGPGEEVFRELCGKAPNTFGKFIDAKPLDLSSIKSGYRLYTEEDLTRKLTYIEASRGCPFGCEFCMSGLDKQVQTFPLPTFLEEMEELMQRGARQFKFLDRTFNFDIDRSQQILEFFLKHISQAPSSAPKYVHFEMVPSRFPLELRKILTRFPPGTLRLEVGIQTFNPKTASLINRNSDPEKELETLEWLRRNTNAIVHADLIAGLPEEDLTSFARGFDRLWSVRPTEIQLGILKCLPGTPLTSRSKEFGIRFSKEPPYETLETSALPAYDLDRIKNFARFWELTINRGIGIDTINSGSIFSHFMRISDQLLVHFKRNWGIDKKELQNT
jgi:radical SAM superfamily enzyme YgiQ (UPF0313 family)